MGTRLIIKTMENEQAIKVLEEIDNIESEDETMEMLERAMNSYCSNYDICEGYKHALRLTINDQYTHHEGEQDEDDLKELMTILNIK